MTTETKKTPAVDLAFLRRSEQLLNMAEGDRLERVRCAIRFGLAKTGKRHGLTGSLAGAFHCMNLAKIGIGEDLEKLRDQSEPEFQLVCLAQVAADLEEVLANVAAELDALGARRAA